MVTEPCDIGVSHLAGNGLRWRDAINQCWFSREGIRASLPSWLLSLAELNRKPEGKEPRAGKSRLESGYVWTSRPYQAH